MPRCVLWAAPLWALFAALCIAAEPLPSESELFDKRFKTEIAPIFTKHCVECHSPTKKKGNLRWDETPTLKAVISGTENWLALLEQVSTGQMPPEDMERPSKKEIDALTEWTRSAIALADKLRPRDPGYVLPRRLNRTEYNNTLRDLTGIDLQLASDFPVDDSGYGFDNIAAVLTMSPLLTEKYIEAAETVIDVGFGAPRPKSKNAGGSGEFGRKRFTLTQGVRYNSGTLEFLSEASAKFTVECKEGSEYVLSANAWQDKAPPDPAHGVLKLDGKVAAEFDVPALAEKPQPLKYHLKATAAKHEFSLEFTNDFYDAKKGYDRNLYIADLKFAAATSPGASASPADPEFAKRVLIAAPGSGVSPEAAAETVLFRFATRAYRRPVTADELARLLKLDKSASKEKGYEAGLKRALTATLVSPHFLLRTESRPPENAKAAPGTVWNLNDYEIATRLSYFFWSSMPDDALFDLAEKGQLKKPDVRASEVKRMLADPKAQALVHNFGGQWLELRNLDEVSPSNRRFPEWNSELSAAMRRECEMLFEEIVKQDHSIMDFIDPGYTFVNEKLAKLYGIKDVTGTEFKRVSTVGSKRGGILTMGSTLAVTSNPTRTSPVKRGKWLLEQVLGTPPPPPPPEIPPLADKRTDEATASLRERLDKHRADPSCAVCHNRMDGYGFALENFDAIGKWRDMDGKFKVDSIGKVSGEEPMDGPEGLKKAVLKRKPQFVRNFAEKMLTYAIGRGTKPYDRATINGIVSRAEVADYKFSSVIMGIVESDAFLKCRDQRPDEK